MDEFRIFKASSASIDELQLSPEADPLLTGLKRMLSPKEWKAGVGD